MHAKTAAMVLTVASFVARDAFAADGKNCLDIAANSPGAIDREYMIEPTPGTVLRVYCAGMSGYPCSVPKDYLTLVRTVPNGFPDSNYSQMTAAGIDGSDLRTSYWRVRIDPSTLRIDMSDHTYSSTVGGPGWGTWVPYGWAGDCAGPWSTSGRANIDLTDTGFVVESVFFVFGFAQAGTISVDGQTPVALTPQQSSVFRGQRIDLTGGGGCGTAAAYGFNSYIAYAVDAAPALQLRWVGP